MDPVFDPSHVLLAELNLSEAGYESNRDYFSCDIFGNGSRRYPEFGR